MRLPSRLRKLVLAIHLSFSVGWIGAVVAYLVLGVTATATADPERVRAAWVAMELIGWYALVPLAWSSVLTGLVLAFGTAWGLFRHYWVLISFVVTLLSTFVLTLHMPDVSALADMAQRADADTLLGLGGDLGHAGLGLAALLAVQVLNVYKPKGLTRHGWRVQQRSHTPPVTSPDRRRRGR